LGYEAGERHTTFYEQERVLLAIANSAKDRVRVVEYGKSVEGRPLRLIFITHPDNLTRLQEIQTANRKLADPRTLSNPAEAETIIASAPVLTWINHTIHGDESASFETVMWTLYTLAASDAPQIVDALKKSVVVLNPAFNPDGHERFVVWYNSVALGNPDAWAFEQRQPWEVRGRYNHYRFDMNRDKLPQSQPETRQETTAYLQWFPQVFVDQHGQPPVYFFPPNALPSNANVDRERVNRWTAIFGQANGKTFDSYGWAYVNQETYDLFAPVYLDSFATLVGAIGMTYETDGGGNVARRRDDGTVSSLRDATAHHLETALTTILTAAEHRENLLRDFYTFRRKAMERGKQKVQQVVIPATNDPNRMAELAELLTQVGIEVRQASGEFEMDKTHLYGDLPKEGAKKRKFPVGTLIVDLAQPQGNLARAYLEPDVDFEPDFVKEQNAKKERNEKRNSREPREGYEFYDITAWSLPMAFGVEAYWSEDTRTIASTMVQRDALGKVRLPGQTGGVTKGRADVAYLFRYDRDSAGVLALRLLQEGFRLQAVIRPVFLGKEEVSRGTLIARVDRNPDTLHQRIDALSEELRVEVQAVNKTFVETAGVGIASENNIVALQEPRIAVIADDAAYISGYGAVWHQLESVGVKFTAIRLSRVRLPDLERYNVLILPEGGGYLSELGKGGVDDLKEWVRRGGVLIGLGEGSFWFWEKEAELTTAEPVGEGDVEEKDEKDEKSEKVKLPKQPTSLPGAIFAAEIDPTHFLGFGYPNGKILVPLGGDIFLKKSTTGSNVVTFGKAPNVRSGFVWSDTEQFLAGTSYVIDEPMGRGHVLLYLGDPTFRAYYPGLRRLFWSGILFAPMNSRPLSY
jgi:hypothetical protein